MRIRTTSSILVTVLFVLFSKGLCLGDESEKVSAKRLAAQLIINKIQEGFKSLSIAEKDFSGKMKDNPKGQFTDPEKSWENLRKEKRTKFEEDYKKEVESLLKKLDSDKPESVSSWFSKEDCERFLEPPKEAIEQSLNSNFGEEYNPKADNVFNTARTGVVKEQQKKFIFDVHPTEVEFETIPHQELEGKLYERLINKQQGLSLFQENRKAIGGPEVVGRILNDALSQQKAQRQIVKQSDGGQKVSPSEIEAVIEDKIKEYQGALEKKKVGEKIASKVYGIFPSVMKDIPERGKALAIKKFFETISTLRVPIETENLKTWIKQNIEKHVKRSESLTLCLGEYRSPICEGIITWSTNKVEDGKKKEFREFLEKTAEDNASCKAAMDKLVESSINEVFDKAREELAEEQFREFFEPLTVRGLWRPSMKQIEEQDNQFRINIPDPLKMPDISSKAFDAEKLLDETRKKVREAEEVLINEGIRALKQQRSIVGKVEFQIKEMISGMSSEKQVKDKFFSITKEEWATNPLAQKYISLFPSVEKLIEEKAAVIWRTERAQREERATIDKAIKKENEKKAAEERATAARAATQAEKQGLGSGDKTDEKKGDASGGGIPGGAGAGEGIGEGLGGPPMQHA